MRTVRAMVMVAASVTWLACGSTGSGGTDTGGTDPGATDVLPVDPGATDPGTVDPGTTTDPGTTDPGTVDPGTTTDPGATDPGTVDPGATDPGATDPGTASDPGTAGQTCKDIYICFETRQCSKTGSQDCENECIATGDAAAQAQWAALRACDAEKCDPLDDGTLETLCNYVDCRPVAEPCIPVGTRTCSGVWECISACQPLTAECGGACTGQGDYEAQILVTKIRICMNEKCPDMSCLATDCKPAVDDCKAN